MGSIKTGACEHWESGGTGLAGHCSHASCWNYMDGCPRHAGYGNRDGEPCTLTHYHEGGAWHRRHDVYGGPHDQVPSLPGQED